MTRDSLEGAAPEHAQVVPEVLFDILAKCWEIEDGSGGWNGGDVVDIVCDVLSGYGLDLRHPAVRTGGTGEVNDYDYDTLRAIAQTSVRAGKGDDRLSSGM
jgi:hypothetical protein